MANRDASANAPRQIGARTGEKFMSDATGKKDEVVSDDVKPAATADEEPMEDEEKILAGRHDVNFPALLTKDVPGG